MKLEKLIDYNSNPYTDSYNRDYNEGLGHIKKTIKEIGSIGGGTHDPITDVEPFDGNAIAGVRMTDAERDEVKKNRPGLAGNFYNDLDRENAEREEVSKLGMPVDKK